MHFSECLLQKKDEEFEVDEDDSDEDVEDSIAEQEKVEKPDEIKREINDLKDEGTVTLLYFIYILPIFVSIRRGRFGNLKFSYPSLERFYYTCLFFASAFNM